MNDENGGLVIYSRNTADWNFEDARERITAYDGISQRQRSVRVPYRQNRLVMFNSNLFHYSDKFEFKKRERRVDLTFLFGREGGSWLIRRRGLNNFLFKA